MNETSQVHGACNAKGYTIDGHEPRTVSEYALRLDAAERDLADLRKRFSEASSRAQFFENENESRAMMLRRYHDLIGYSNHDGFHSEPGPEEMLRSLVADRQYAIQLREALVMARRYVSQNRGGWYTKETLEAADAALAKNPNEFQTRQQGSNSDLPGSVRIEMGAVGPASECKEVIAARERLEPEGRPSADAEQCDRMGLSDARNGVTARRDEQLTERSPTRYICVACDGCGWCEGSPAFKCERCDGAGTIGPNPWGLCSDCPPKSDPPDRRCLECPRREVSSSFNNTKE